MKTLGFLLFSAIALLSDHQIFAGVSFFFAYAVAWS